MWRYAMKPKKFFKIGDSAELTRRITTEDVMGFAKLTKDYNPIHFENSAAKEQGFENKIVHGMLVGSLFSQIIGTELPGDGTVYLSQTLEFIAPVKHNDVIRVVVKIKNILPNKKYLLDTVCYNQNGVIVVKGEAKVKLQ